MQLNNAQGVIEVINNQGGVLFKAIFAKDIKARANEPQPQRPKSEQDAIADIFRRMDEIQENLAHERRQ